MLLRLHALSDVLGTHQAKPELRVFSAKGIGSRALLAQSHRPLIQATVPGCFVT